jgi:hypothetical protein
MTKQRYIGEHTIGEINRMPFGTALAALLEAEVLPTMASPTSPAKALTPRRDEIVTIESVFQHRSNATSQSDGERDYESDRHIKEMATALRNMPAGEKRLDPILVKSIDNAWVCVDGHHRLKAYDMAGVQDIPARAFAGSVKEAVVKAGAENSKAKLPMTMRDRMNTAWRITAAQIASKHNTAVSAGVSDGTVATMRRLWKRLSEAELNPADFDYYEARELDKGGNIGERGEDWEEQQVARIENALFKVFGKSVHRNREFHARALENRYPSLIGMIIERNACEYREQIELILKEEEECPF